MLEREETPIKLNIENGTGTGSVTFENVSFTYPGTEQEILHDISLTIHGGEKIAIVGENGSGKSTFISLLTGLFSPNDGQIKIDNLSLEENKQH